jgi:hypothetical protein
MKRLLSMPSLNCAQGGGGEGWRERAVLGWAKGGGGRGKGEEGDGGEGNRGECPIRCVCTHTRNAAMERGRQQGARAVGGRRRRWREHLIEEHLLRGNLGVEAADELQHLAADAARRVDPLEVDLELRDGAPLPQNVRVGWALEYVLEHGVVPELAGELERREAGAVALQALRHAPHARLELLVAAQRLLEPQVGQVDQEVVHRGEAVADDGVHRREAGEDAELPLAVEVDAAAHLVRL